MATTIRPATSEEDPFRKPRNAQKFEFVDGQIRVSPAGGRHGSVCVQLSTLLNAFVKERHLGHVFESSTGFRLPGGNIRLPDVSFVAKGRFAAERPPDGSPELAPDLAIEVLAPGDRPRYVLDRVGEYLQAGVRLVWIISPQRRAAAAYRSPTSVRGRGPDDILEGEDIVPGFRCRLTDVLE